MLDHEKLHVYQAALRFLDWLNPVFEETPKGLAARDQLDRASTSVPLNLAEGNGKFSVKDRCRYFEIARGSALECAACLDVLVVKKVIAHERAAEGKAHVESMVSMIFRLIQSLVGNQVREDAGIYSVAAQGDSEHEQEHEHEFNKT